MLKASRLAKDILMSSCLVSIGFLFVWLWMYGENLKGLAVLGLLLFFLKLDHRIIWALIFSSLIIGPYFFIHLDSNFGSHDLKVILVIFSFLIPVVVLDKYSKLSKTDISLLYFFMIPMFLLSIFFVDRDFSFSGLSDAETRYRGVFFFFLIALLFAKTDLKSDHSFLHILMMVVIAYQISGSRAEVGFLFLALIMLFICRSRPSLWWVTPFVFLVFPFGISLIHMILELLIHNGAHTVWVRAQSVQVALSELTLFGNGMIPAVVDFLYHNNYRHFFVPADIRWLGKTWELGIYIWIIYLIYLFCLISWFRKKVSLASILMVFSFTVLDYNLSTAGLEIAASALIFRLLPKRLLQ